MTLTEKDLIDELSALVIATATAANKPPRDMSRDAYARAMAILDSLDASADPHEVPGRIATSDNVLDGPQPRESEHLASTSASWSPVVSHQGLTSVSLPLPTSSKGPRQLLSTDKPEPAWKHLTEHQKFAEAFRVAEDHQGFSFSLDLSDRVERTLWTHRDPCRLLSTYINKALKAHGIAGTPYAFAVEYAPLEENYRGDLHSKLHLHGVVIASDLSKVKAALLAAGGKVGRRSRSRQVKFALLDPKRGGGDGWRKYTLKDEDRTRRHLDGERVLFINDRLRQLSQARWQERQPKKAPAAETIAVATDPQWF